LPSCPVYVIRAALSPIDDPTLLCGFSNLRRRLTINRDIVSFTAQILPKVVREGHAEDLSLNAVTEEFRVKPNSLESLAHQSEPPIWTVSEAVSRSVFVVLLFQ